MRIEVTFAGGYPNFLGVVTLAQAMCVLCRSLDLISWPWWFVLAPAWMTLALVAGCVAALLVARRAERETAKSAKGGEHG